MSRIEADLQDQNAGTAPAVRGAERERASEPRSAIASAQTASTLNPALFSAHGVAAESALPLSRSEYKRSTPSSEWWVQITLCVIVTALLLAVISVPKRSDLIEVRTSHQMAHDLLVALQKLRISVSDYRFDHGAWPGTNSGSSLGDFWRMDVKEDQAQTLERQLVDFSDVTGETSTLTTPNCPLGPYLDGHFPVNPINGLSSVRLLDEVEEWPVAPDDATGWLYRSRTGEVRANCRGFVPASALRFYDL